MQVADFTTRYVINIQRSLNPADARATPMEVVYEMTTSRSISI
jgi:hypothetical protein